MKKMVSDAEMLSKEIPFVRADFYEVAGQYYFGELTFFPGGGFEEFDLPCGMKSSAPGFNSRIVSGGVLPK